MRIIYAENTKNSDKISNKYIAVNNCGLFSMTDINTIRRKGRSDYQLIYLKNGSGNYVINNCEHKLTSGDLLIYKPFEEQIYTIYAESKPEMYWIHFTGTGIDELLYDTGLNEIKCINIGTGTAIEKHFTKIISEIQLKRNGYELFLSAYFLELFANISRSLDKKNHTPQKYEKLNTVIEYINTHPNDTLTIMDYAKMCCVDSYYFIALFKEYTGKSPIAYRTEQKMSAAAQLLLETDMQINEIAQFLGFKDALYFSRAFKKHIGKSPYAFRCNYLK